MFFKFPKGVGCEGPPKGRGGPTKEEMWGFRAQVSRKNFSYTCRYVTSFPRWELACRSSAEAG